MRIIYEQNKTSRRAQPTAPTSISPTPLYRIGSPGGGGGNLVPSANSVPINRIQVPLLFNKTRPQVSMYKFIKSRGKQVTSDNSLTGNYYIECDTKYRPPKFVTADFYRKRLSAFDKIQEELRENKQREDELRFHRQNRLFGQSYPNLNSMCDEDFTSDDQTIGSSEENKDSFHSRCSSNPDLPNPSESPSNHEEDLLEPKVGGPRRRIPLIDLWEQRIQQDKEKK